MSPPGDFISTLAGNQESSGIRGRRCLSSSIRTSFPRDVGQDTEKVDTWSNDKKIDSIFDN